MSFQFGTPELADSAWISKRQTVDINLFDTIFGICVAVLDCFVTNCSSKQSCQIIFQLDESTYF